MFSLVRSFFLRRWPVLLAILAVAGLAWGAKLMLIRVCGSDVPYMDQWDAQASQLYLPWTEHRLAASAFWAPHNEHRLPLTRLTNFGLTLVNRQWDPLLEMSVNAALHAAFAAALLIWARRQTRGVAFAGGALVVAALFALPFAWENTLAGFQSQFYFLAWTALGFLWLTLPAVPLSARWWAGVVVGLVGLGSMSSGFLCAAAALGVVAFRAIWCDRRWTWRDRIAAAIYLTFCVVGPLLVTRVPGHAVLKVTSAGQWLHVFCHVLAWPANVWLVAAVVLQLPLVAFLLGRLRARRLDGPDAVLLGLALWCWGQAAVVAYSRGNLGMGDSPRYYDLYAIGIALNAIALARGWQGRAAKLWPVVAVVWVATLAYGLHEKTAQAYRDYLDAFPAVKATERRRLVDFIRTGDLDALRRAPEELPHNSADSIAHVLSHPGMRRLLPVGLRPPLALSAASAETHGFARTPPDDLPGKPEYSAVWRAARGPARFVSEPLPANCLPVLRLTFAGSPDLPSGAVYLESADGHRTALQIASFRGDRWQTAHLALPAGGAVRFVVDLPAGDHWLAFADPVEMGRGSWYAYNLRKWAGEIFWGCAGLLALALVALCWSEPPGGGWWRLGGKVSEWSLTFLRAVREKLSAAHRGGAAAMGALLHGWIALRTKLAPVTAVLARPPIRWGLVAASLVAAFCVILGAKLSTIHTYGSDVPYMDQWDAEAWLLYMPYTEGKFPTTVLFSPHNEHRVLFTRLINLGLTIGNRQWDPLLQMSVNALLSSGFALLLLLYARKLARGIAYGAVLAVVVVLFALPLVWENTLAGFQSQFYLLQLSGLGTLWLMLSGRSLDGRWWLGFLVALAGLGTMSTGFFCAPPLLVAMALRGWWRRAWSGRDTVAAALLAAYTVVGVLLVQHVPYHDQFRAGTPGQFGQALLAALSWPAPAGLLAAAALSAPWLLFLANRWRARSLEPADAVLLALGLWCGLQTAALAYGRGGGGIGSNRYSDLYAIGVIANALALVRLWRRPTIVPGVATFIWLAFWVLGIVTQRTEATAHLHSLPAAKEREREHVRAFVLSGDSAALRRAPAEELPHTRAESLIFYLSHPGIRSLLPVSVRPALPLVASDPGGFARTPPDDLPGKPDTAVWRARRGPAKFVSEPLPANCLPVLRLTFAGSPGLPPGALHLESADGHRTTLQIASFRGDRWQTAHLALPIGNAVRLVAELPAGDHWLAFADPAEMGRFSWHAYCLRKQAGWIFWSGAGLLALAIVALCWSEPPDERWATSQNLGWQASDLRRFFRGQDGIRWIAAGVVVALLALPLLLRTGHDPTTGTHSYGHFLAATLTVTMCLFVPGWCWRVCRPASRWAETARLPVPGLLLLAFYGLILWLTKSASATWPAGCFLALNAGLAAVALFKQPVSAALDTTAVEARALWPLGIWSALVAGVLAVGLNPLPVADEYLAQTTLPGRMVASPPDHLIPYQTAGYFWQGKDGRQDSKTYFGDWSVTSRGPLAPLAITGLFNLFGIHPDDPPSPAEARLVWPVASDGAYLARILGWLTNACVILGAGRLLLALGSNGAGARLGLVWLALAPVTLINTVFLWPKMLATFFLLLATAALLERRWRTAAGWVALAWLSHPVGALFLPPLGLLGAHAVWLAERERGTGWRTRAGRALGALAGFAGLTLLLTSPWLGYKLWVGHSDVFMRYPLGDGHGTALAVSLASWARTRWDNLWYTLVPGAFFASDQMSVWIMGPLTASMRWIIQYAKSLPGNLGYAGFGLVAVALMRRPRERPALVWWHLGAGAFALMLLFWGFSSDGLGRNCLEPLSIALLIATAATWSDRHPRLLPLWVGLVGIDSLWVVLGGFASARDFRLSQIDFAAGGWCALDVILTIALLWWSVWVWRNRDRINASVGTAWRGSMPSYRECLAAGRRLLAAWHAYFAAWPRPVQIALGVVLLAIALFLRKPDALLNPQFWAEDGSEFFLKNDQHGLGAWLLPYAGYLHLVPRLVVWAAGFADPRWLPALYSGASFLIWIAVIARCWAPRLELPHKVWLPVAFLFAAHTTEVVFVLTNVIWITAFLLLQQVFMSPPARWWGRMMELALVGIAALTGPFVIILWPLFAWSFWRRRTAYSAMVFTVVSIAGLIQLGCIWYSPTEVNHLAETLATPIEGFARITQWTLALYLGGASFALALSNGVLIGIGIAVLLLWLAVTRRPPVEPAVWWAISYALVAMLAASFYRGSPSGIIGMGDRYYFIPRVLVGWLLIWLAVGDSRRSRVVRFVAVLAICINLPGYRLPPATDYHWAQNCAPLRDGQPARIPILPDGWILQYPGRPMR